jgi:hypothetical protein
MCGAGTGPQWTPSGTHRLPPSSRHQYTFAALTLPLCRYESVRFLELQRRSLVFQVRWAHVVRASPEAYSTEWQCRRTD